MPKMTPEEFEKLTGHPPQHDDLERVNCPHANGSKRGHAMCGVCDHGQPKFLGCDECELRIQKILANDVD